MLKKLLAGTVCFFLLVIAPAAYGQAQQGDGDKALAEILQRIERLEAENRAYKARLQEIERELAASPTVRASTAAELPTGNVEAHNITEQASTLAEASTGIIADQNAGFVRFDHSYAYDMLDPTTDINSKQLTLLEQRRDGKLEENAVYFGGAVTAIANYWHSNRDSKFGYLMRHPTAGNQVGKTVSEAIIHSAQINFTASLGDWVSAYGEMLYDPEQSFGRGTNTDLTRNQIQLRRGYVLFGNLEKLPLYGAIGKMSTPFGLTDTVNPFTASTNWHAFGGLAYGALVGFNKGGLHVRAEAVQGGAQFRATNTPVSGTNVPSKLNNYVVDANYTFDLGSGANDIMFGGSYERGSTYCQSFPVVHFQPCDKANPAWAVYGRAHIGKFTLQGEFNRTTDVWPGTFNPSLPLSIYAAHKVSSLSLGGKYTTRVIGKRTAFSFEFSTFVAGPQGSPWRRQNQWVLGSAIFLSDSVKLFGEGLLVEGYSPLNFISGGNLAPGETHSDSTAESIGVILGVNAAF